MNKFYSSLKETMAENSRSITENGALGYATTGDALLDLNFKVSSYRSLPDSKIVEDFSRAYYENPTLAVVWLFMARDVRSGMGERRFFRVCLCWLACKHPDICRKILPLVAEYGRWDDLLTLLDDTPVSDNVVSLIYSQLVKDIYNRNLGKPISLLAKWLPSEKASSQKSKRQALFLAENLGRSPAAYRRTLSMLRKHINIVERSMSENRWNEINYEAVPSKANLLYRNAFLRHDKERREAYLDSLQRGETKINSFVAFPCDIVQKYSGMYAPDVTLEEMWKALPDTVGGNSNTIVVADGSLSMLCQSGKTGMTALSVANSLAIYFAEHASGAFKDKYITFSMNPQLVDFSNAQTLREKINIALQYNEAANTNIEAVFDLILNTALENNLKQEDLPQNILIISDMEFDACAKSNAGFLRYEILLHDETLFAEIARKYQSHGYKLPRLIFWNVASRTGTIPVRKNELGVSLVSGFSPNIMKMVLSEKLDPKEAMLDMLNGERYAPVREALAA